MKKLTLWVVALVTIAAAVVRAQDITGSWQGTLQAGRPLRVVFKITNEGGALKTVMYSIDQGGQTLAASTDVTPGHGRQNRHPGYRRQLRRQAERGRQRHRRNLYPGRVCRCL